MKIYVGNMSYDTQEDTIKELFGKYGEVSSVNVITFKDTGRSKGFGFIEMESAEAGESAINELNGQELDGRKLIVSIAKEKPARRNDRNFNRSRNNSYQR